MYPMPSGKAGRYGMSAELELPVHFGEEICPDHTLLSVPLHPLDITGSLLGNRVAPCAGTREQQTDGWAEGRITRKGRPPVITGKW